MEVNYNNVLRKKINMVNHIIYKKELTEFIKKNKNDK